MNKAWSARAVAFVFSVGVVSAPPVAWSQTQEQDYQENETEAIEQSRKAADRAADLRARQQAGAVTYQDVLKDPDNAELNFEFARGQVLAGNFRGASTTLERILRLRPELAPVRLLYAIVLFQLDNYAEAEREFLAVSELDIDESIRAEIDLFLERIKLSRQKTRYSASLSVGAHLDTNKTSAPRSQILLVSDTAVNVARAEADFGYIGVASYSVNHDLGYQDGHEVFGSLTFFYDDQTAEDSQDLQSFTIKVGGTMRGAFEEIDVTPSLFRTNVRLSREAFLRETGFGLRLERSFGKGFRGYTDFALSTQTFDQISENATGSERNGRQFSLSVGGNGLIFGNQLLGVEIQHLDKSSKGDALKFFSFERNQLSLNHTWLFSGGQFLLNSFTYQRDRYDDPDVFISNRTRRDDIFRYRITYGAPLSFFFGEGNLPKEIEDISFTPSVEAFRSKSNINNNDYQNFKYQVLLTKSWQF